MPTRVLHLRVDEETILSALELYSIMTNKLGVPPSTKISTVLTQLMKKLRADGSLNSYPAPEISIRLRHFLDIGGEENFTIPEFSIPSIAEYNPSSEERAIYHHGNPEVFKAETVSQEEFTGLMSHLKEAADPRTRLRELIEQGVERVTQPRVELDPNIWAPDPESLPDPGEFLLNFDQQPRLSGSELAVVIADYAHDKRATRFLDAANEKNKNLIFAYAIALYVVPKEHWFSEQCEALVNRVHTALLKAKSIAGESTDG